MNELIERRTANSKTFAVGKRSRRCEIYAGPIHYKDNYDDDLEQWKDIDCSWYDGRITAAPYTAEIDGLTLRVTDKQGGKVSTVRLAEIGRSSLVVSNPHFVFDRHIARITDFALDTDLEIVAGPDTISFTRVLKSDKAPLDARFDIQSDMPVVYRAEDADGEPLKVTVSEDGSETIAPAHLVKDDGSPVRYPLRIDPTLTVYSTDQDNYIYQGAPTGSYGYRAYLRLAAYTNYVMRGLFGFDISGLPSGATLNSASMSLYYYYDPYSRCSGRTVWAYKQTHNDWLENQSTWNIYKTGSNWSSSGGDYVTSNPSGGSTTYPGSTGAWMSWSILAIVQDAYDGSINVNILLREADETENEGSRTLGGFYSSEEAEGADYRPKLVIDYTPGLTYEESITENFTLDDTPAAFTVMPLALTENLELAGTLVPSLVIEESLVDSFELDDAPAAQKEYNPLVSEGLELDDSLSSQVEFNPSVTENLELSDVLASQAEFNSAIVEALELSDTLAASVIFQCGIIEALELTDTLIANVIFDVSITEALELSDLLTEDYIAVVTVGRPKYRLEIHNSSGDLLYILKNPIIAGYTQTLNEPYTLSLDTPADEDAADELVLPNELWLKNMDTGTVIRKFLIHYREDRR